MVDEKICRGEMTPSQDLSTIALIGTPYLTPAIICAAISLLHRLSHHHALS